MQVKRTNSSDTEVVLEIKATESELQNIKNTVLGKLSHNVKLPGFREGKAPASLIEKNLDQSVLQTEFLEEAVSQIYPQAIISESLRPVDRPEISIKKYVPFSTLEFEAKVAVVGDIKLPDYKKIKKEYPKVDVNAEDVKQVLSSLQKQIADKKVVDRAAKTSDEVSIDFNGVNEKGEKINGADGKDYPLVLGSNTFIPGFEDQLVGKKAGDETTFTLTFPKDYGVKSMANKKVTFTVNINSVKEVLAPKLDDDFAAKAGPFDTLKALKEDIKRQLEVERQQQMEREFESELVRDITAKSKVVVPQILIDEQIDRMWQEMKQNLVYRGQTVAEFLESEAKSEDAYKSEVLKPQAEERVKASLVLTEISEKEKLDVTPEELEIRIQLLKSQYKDQAMQSELDKPENRNDIASRLLTEKTVSKLKEYVTAK
jgi:trigger factor